MGHRFRIRACYFFFYVLVRSLTSFFFLSRTKRIVEDQREIRNMANSGKNYLQRIFCKEFPFFQSSLLVFPGIGQMNETIIVGENLLNLIKLFGLE